VTGPVYWENISLGYIVEVECETLQDCSNCQRNPLCGWCNDPEDTGKLPISLHFEYKGEWDSRSRVVSRE